MRSSIAGALLIAAFVNRDRVEVHLDGTQSTHTVAGCQYSLLTENGLSRTDLDLLKTFDTLVSSKMVALLANQ